jgi:hypothetical protein
MATTRLAKIQARMTVAERAVFDHVPGSTDAEKILYLLEHRTLAETIREGVREEVALSLGRSAMMLKGSLESPDSPFRTSVKALDEKLDRLLQGEVCSQAEVSPQSATSAAHRELAQPAESHGSPAAEVALRKVLARLVDVGVRPYADEAKEPSLDAAKKRLLDARQGIVPVVADVLVQVAEIFMLEGLKGQEAHALFALIEELATLEKR